MEGAAVSGMALTLSSCLLARPAGQQQLVCLARAILRRPSIVCLDECTASVDPATAALMQDLLRAELPHATVLQVLGPLTL